MADDFSKLDAFLASEGKKNEKGGASLLPTPVNPAWFDPTTKSWYGEQDRKDLTAAEKRNCVPCKMIVHFSPTNRASCRRCGEKIEKDQLRLGFPFRFNSREDPYTMYLHPECYVPEVFGIKEKELRSQVLGYAELNNSEKAQLWKAMRSDSKDRQASKDGQAATNSLNTKSIGSETALAVKQVKIPKEITAPMLPFQKEGVSWMVNQEQNSKVRGGILADEMGMGKTIQAISLMCANPMDGPTLVVVPMAAVSQWAREIERFTRKGSLTTMIYHGAQRTKHISGFKKVDVVITTYQTMESEYRQVTNKARVTCKYCKKLFSPEKIIFHQKYHCGPNAVRTLKQQRTQKKDKQAALKGMATLGIGQGMAANSVYAPPTITNIYKDYMKRAGHDIKAAGYWNVQREASGRASSSSSSSKAPASKADHMSRERLSLLDREDLVEMCVKKGLDKTGRKPDLVDRLMTSQVKNMTRLSNAQIPEAPSAMKVAGASSSSMKVAPKLAMKAAYSAGRQCSTPNCQPCQQKSSGSLGCGSCRQSANGCLRCNPLKAAAAVKAGRATAMKLGVKLTAAVKAKIMKAQKQQAYKVEGLKGAKGKKAMMAAPVKTSGARTVANQRGAPTDGKGKQGKDVQGKGKKRTHEEMVCQPCGEEAEIKTFLGPQLDLSESPLHAMKWSRIILDEAHRIKGRTNSTAMAAYALDSNGFKWCLSGTPLQNRVGELYSLIRFLRMKPYAFYYCKKKGCNCECARFMRDRYCPNCGHVRFLHYSHFKRNVTNPITKYGYMGAGKQAFVTLRNDILGKAMLRRTKEERKADLKLPPIKIQIRRDAMSREEKDFYQSIFMNSQVKFDTYIQAGTVLHNYAHIFDLLTSLRRACDHPYLITHGGGEATHKLPDGKKMVPKIGAICGLCQDDVLEGGEEIKRTAACGHVFHDDCIRAYIEDAPKLKNGGVGCPVCFTKLSIDLGEGGGSDDEGKETTPMKKARKAPTATPPKGSPAKAAKPVLGKFAKKEAASPKRRATKAGVMQKVRATDWKSSTKIEALADEIKKMMKGDRLNKGIVFSQFTAMLELVEFRLKKEGISCVVFKGGMSMQARDDAIQAFNSEPSLRVILISLKAGGEGLNLQVANHVFLLDPWWNPACELQAIQRAHRIGQTRQVNAVRFVTKDTIEERIISLQEKKQLVFDASIDGSQASLGKLTEQDIKFLFQQ